MMAASVYATPPPDLSGEDTALSDASNSSQTNSSSNHSQSKKRTLSAASTPGPITPGSTNLLDMITPDLSKKRRKQSTPIRISANNATTNNNVVGDAANNGTNGEVTEEMVTDENDEKNNGDESDVNMSESTKLETIDLEEEQPKSIENSIGIIEKGEISVIPLSQLNNDVKQNNEEQKPETTTIDALEAIKLLKQQHDFEASKKSPKQNDDVDEQPEDARDKSPDIKKEQTMIPEWDGEIKRKFPSKPEEWLQLAGLPFPFTPETAAALQASGYFPQLPMLGVPPVPTFTSSDGTTRPANIPPRIFNPEAYCDLCNKEFCNKYFLKTHKANKHGIYEPPVSNADMASLNQIGQIQQMSQLLQMQQQRQQEQVMSQVAAAAQHAANNEMNNQGSTSPTSSSLAPQSILTIENTVYCDICFKKFNNVFSMRKHRSKVHEGGGTQINGDGNGNKQEGEKQEETNTSFPIIKIPEGFREDYSVEQEDVSFTPQPRKLSPISIQQAREANFSFDKLKRLGVINPEAFCELCGKEYCNKYFLRTHKLKRHGIPLMVSGGDDSHTIRDEQTSSHRPTITSTDRPPWHHIQTSPLNLIVSGLDPTMPLLRQAQQQQQHPINNDDSSENASNSPKDNSMKQESSNNITDEEKLSQPRTPLNQQDAEAISVDLQKLQSMIMQLNDINSHRPAQCTICGKDVENRYMLHAHMISEHSGLGDNNNGIKTSQESSPIPMGQEFEMCKLCDKEFSNVFMLKQHVIDVHGMQADMSPIRDGFVTPDRPMVPLNLPSTPGPNDRRPSFQMTPTSSYCEICNKELCNKYFMKTHMQRMHGIEIENGAQIGGVVCNICNKELCSKYFLRVHKHNTHGIVDDGSPLPPNATRMNGDSLDTDGSYSQDANLKPGEVGEMSNRYFSHFTEVCPLCNRRFRSAKWLKAHLMSDHGKAGTDKLKELETKMSLTSKTPSPGLKIPNGNTFGLPSPEQNLLSMSTLFAAKDQMASSSQPIRGGEYRCSQCPFTTPIFPIIYLHERSHGINMPLMPQQQQQQLPSESAVSLAKDQQQQQQRASQPTSAASSNETPTSTPASTPIPQLVAQEPNLGLLASIGKPPLNIEPFNILNEMANLTQRPAVYALPQETQQENGPFVMQSFLVEESNDHKMNANNVNNIQANKKFVPVVVFLPVKERIVSPINVSFTLTPA